jgi:sugar phosphate isomerase/epimerase
MNNRYAFSTGALYPLESDHALRLLKDAGFQHAELMPQAFDDISDQAALRYEASGVHVATIHYPLAMFAMLYSSHQTMSKEGRKLSDDLVRMSRRLGTEVIVIHPTSVYTPEQRPVLEVPVMANINHLAQLCTDAGITLGMENYPVGVGQHPDTLQDYIKSLGWACIKPVVDTTEVCEGGGDPVAFLRAIDPRPCHLHLSDFGGGKKHLAPGTGDIDWAGVAGVLAEKGYTGYYTLEPAYKNYLTDIPAKLRSAYEFAARTF